MTEEPYRWLEAIANRREYIATQLQGGTPVLASCLADGILLVGVGSGHSKVFELFDRHALAGLGHPADLERVRQSMIDAAHVESFTRSSSDVSLRRLVSFGLAAQLKAAFEQIFAPPCLVRLILAEVTADPSSDLLVTVDFDGTFQIQHGGFAVVADPATPIDGLRRWLQPRLLSDLSPARAAHLMLEAWHALSNGAELPDEPADPATLAARLGTRTLEAGLLRRTPGRPAHYVALSPAQLNLPSPPPAPPAA